MSGNDNSTSDPYVERNLSVDEFCAWLYDPKPNVRMRSIVGPPGSGKTTFLTRLCSRIEKSRCCVLPTLQLTPYVLKLDIASPPDEVTWFDSALVEARNQCHVIGENGFREKQLRDWFSIFVQHLCDKCHPPVLLIDGHDDLQETEQAEFEQYVLRPFLFPDSVTQPPTRVLIARRDELEWGESTFKWEDDVCRLEPLDNPEEQIRSRLRYIQQPNQPISWAQVSAPARATLQELGEGGIDLVVEQLRDSLTPSPFINVFLLERQLEKPGARLTRDDYRQCLAAYVERAGLEGPYVEFFIKHVREVEYRSFPASRTNQIGSSADWNRLMEKSIVGKVPESPQQFQFDEAVVHLVKLLNHGDVKGGEQ